MSSCKGVGGTAGCCCSWLLIPADLCWNVLVCISKDPGFDSFGAKRLSEACNYFKETWGCSQTCGNCSEASTSCWGREKDKTPVLGLTVWKHQMDISTPGSSCLSRFSQRGRHRLLLQIDAWGHPEASAMPPIFLGGARVMAACPNVSQESKCFPPSNSPHFFHSEKLCCFPFHHWRDLDFCNSKTEKRLFSFFIWITALSRNTVYLKS